MLLVQKYIQEKGLQSLVDEFAINIKRHKDYPNLVLLKYDQISTPVNNLTRECRGLILDENDSWKIINYSYFRFPNVGQDWGDKELDWSTTKIFEKVDGSLLQVFYYDNKWNCATSGMPDAQGMVDDHGFSFADLFWKTWNELGYQLPKDINCCYAFEMMTNYNQLVVKNTKNRIVLHGARNLSSLKELSPEPIAQQNGWEVVQSFKFNSIKDVIDAASKLPAFEAEGFVVCDFQFNRQKVKSPQHVWYSYLRSSLSSSKRNIIEFIRKGESAELLAYLPALKVEHDELKLKYDLLAINIENTYNEIKDIVAQKDFATKAIKYKYSAALFQLRSKKVNNIKEFLLNMQVKTLEEWL